MSLDQTTDIVDQIEDISIEDEIKASYLDYAMSVIIGRAIPDVRDGLKPVHRRILYGMHELHNDFNKPYKKSARVVGDVMGKYHPHGDSAIYDAVVRMAQDFSMRYVLVDGQGNFGSVDGDPPAAMRYTEIRMDKLAHEYLRDIEKDTVEFQPNYDNSLEEPTIMPTRVPGYLLNGSSGIAVGMATNVPPHNLKELCRGIIALLENPDITIPELIRFIPGPDFPTGGYICGTGGIKSAYETGKGSIKMRAKHHVEDASRKKNIIVTELPYQVNKAKLIEKIHELVKEKKIEGITDARDESDRTGMRIVISVRSDIDPKVIENQLYKHTPLELSFGVTMLAVVDGRPEILTLKRVLEQFVSFRRQIIVRRAQFELRQAEKRLHILEGLRIALQNTDDIIKVIREAGSPVDAKQNLIISFPLSEIQAQAILEMRLQRLTGLERQKIEDEHAQVTLEIERLRMVLASAIEVDKIIKSEIEELITQFGDVRKTQIVGDAETLSIEDLITEEDMVVTITQGGYIKRTPLSVYRSQKRGGKGRMGMHTKEEDVVTNIYTGSTHDFLLFITNKGKTFQLKVHQLPENSSISAGKAIVNLLKLEEGEKVQAVLPIKEYKDDQYLVMATRNGTVKKTKITEYANIRSTGKKGIDLVPGDEVICAKITDGSDDLFLMASTGKCIRIEETDVRPVGYWGRGVRGMLLNGGQLIGMDVINNGKYMLVVTQKGYGKKTRTDEYRTQMRGGKGVINLNITEKNGGVVGLAQITDEDQIVAITDKGQLIRTKVSGISTTGRFAQGVKVISLHGDESVVGIAVIADKEEEDNQD